MKVCPVPVRPWLSYHFPKYRDCRVGGWHVRNIVMAAARGYWGEVGGVTETAVMCGPGEGPSSSWMSLLPSEVESQEIGLHAAHGHTVICGLGMGWLAANTALRPEVTRVTVVERDPDVISLVEAAGAFEGLPADVRRKVTVVQADALEWRPDTPVDVLQADIWLRFVQPRKLADVQQMQRNIEASMVYFWGQEMEIWRHACRRHGGLADSLDWPAISGIIEHDIRLPLIVPDWADYPDRIVSGAPWWTPKEEGWWRAD